MSGRRQVSSTALRVGSKHPYLGLLYTVGLYSICTYGVRPYGKGTGEAGTFRLISPVLIDVTCLTTQVSASSVLSGVLRTGRELVLAPYLVGEHLIRVKVNLKVRVRVRVRVRVGVGVRVRVRVGEHLPLR